MGKETRAACENILALAERRGLCASPTNRAELNRFTYLRSKGELVTPYAGLFASADVWSRLLPSQRTRRVMRTLARLHPSWIFVGPSAALVYYLAVPPSAMWPLCIATTGNGTCETYAHAIRRRVSPSDVLVINGMRTTSLDRAVVDCMRTLEFPSALAIADSYLRKTNQPKERLEAMVASPQMGKAGIRNARLVASFSDGRAESWGESEARAAIIELGFQIPELQVPYQDPVTGKWYRADFSWSLGGAPTVIGEMDGLLKYTDSSITGGDTVGAFVRERQRESRLTIGGRSVMRFTPAQVKDRPYFERLLESYGIPRGEPLAGWKARR